MSNESLAFDEQTRQRLIQLVESAIEGYLNDRTMPDKLRRAMRYAVLGPGKRIRPLLCYFGCAATGASIELATPPAAAIEMIHAFSLAHDDLPAMDDDDLRRGRPTLHKYADEAMAILAGDALNTMAFELLSTRIEDPALAGKLVKELALATDDMIAGQVYDTAGGMDPALEPIKQLEMIHHNKTGALIRCALTMGALCGGAEAGQRDALTRYGKAIGLMFQVVDDLLDVTQDTHTLGKTAGKDVTQDKMTYPALLGLDGTRRQIRALHQQADEALAGFDEQARPLRELAQFLAVRNK